MPQQQQKNKIEENQKMYQKLVQYKKEVLKNNFLFFLGIKRMSENTLKFNNIKVNTKEFNKSTHFTFDLFELT